ncbi:hypothetical protein CYMTET_53421 [Cymbomonas tetramitiformis]|uniref:Ion transport domain-containing protein n=1 Tax=Cymbomonas tetramitiformis TaxID=36881 RepID=A0AAE0BIC3_9CHLO|nr:hypothetical protein CYMTET_53421 [Cymbomonas tetramitiformis]
MRSFTDLAVVWTALRDLVRAYQPPERSSISPAIHTICDEEVLDRGGSPTPSSAKREAQPLQSHPGLAEDEFSHELPHIPTEDTHTDVTGICIHDSDLPGEGDEVWHELPHIATKVTHTDATGICIHDSDLPEEDDVIRRWAKLRGQLDEKGAEGLRKILDDDSKWDPEKDGLVQSPLAVVLLAANNTRRPSKFVKPKAPNPLQRVLTKLPFCSSPKANYREKDAPPISSKAPDGAVAYDPHRFEPSLPRGSVVAPTSVPDDKWTVLDPQNSFRRGWDVAVLLVLLYTAYGVPYRLSFDNTPTTFSTTLDTTTDAIFLIDIFMNFVTAVEDEKQLIFSHTEIAKKYLKGWFAVDLMASVPWHWLMDDGSMGLKMSKVMRLLKTSRFAKLIRMMRMLRMVKVLTKMADLERDVSHPGLLRLIKICFFITVLVHWFACLTHTIATTHENKPGTSLRNIDSLFMVDGYLDKDPQNQYMYCLYWVTTIMLGHKTDPQSQATLVLTLSIFWIGSSVLVSAFGNVIALVGEMDQAESMHRIKVDKALTYMRRLQVPRTLRSRITEYYDTLYEATKGIDGETFMNQLPRHLRQEMAIFLNRGLIEQMPLFWHSSVPFMVAVFLCLKARGDRICESAPAPQGVSRSPSLRWAPKRLSLREHELV